MPVYPEILQTLLQQRQNAKGKHEIHAHRAALVKGRNIIVRGDNHYVPNRISVHAEATVLDKLVLRGSKKYNLYVVRTGQGEWGGNSRPCIHCLQRMDASGIIDRVIFSNGTKYTTSSLNKLLNEDNQHISAGHRHFGCLEEEDDEEENKPNL